MCERWRRRWTKPISVGRVLGLVPGSSCFFSSMRKRFCAHFINVGQAHMADRSADDLGSTQPLIVGAALGRAEVESSRYREPSTLGEAESELGV